MQLQHTITPSFGQARIPGYVAECLEIPVVTQGATLDESAANLREAGALHHGGEELRAMGFAPNPQGRGKHGAWADRWLTCARCLTARSSWFFAALGSRSTHTASLREGPRPAKAHAAGMSDRCLACPFAPQGAESQPRRPRCPKATRHRSHIAVERCHPGGKLPRAYPTPPIANDARREESSAPTRCPLAMPARCQRFSRKAVLKKLEAKALWPWVCAVPGR